MGSIAGTALGDEVSNLFKDPPQCLGVVFQTIIPWTLGSLSRKPYSEGMPSPGEVFGKWTDTIDSDPITDAKSECGGAPVYQLTYSILRTSEVMLPGGSLGKQSFVPVVHRDLNQ